MRGTFTALAVALLAVAAAAAPVAHFAQGTIPGTIRYQVVTVGPTAGDISGTLGDLTNLEVLAGPVLAQEITWRGAEPVATTVLTWVLRARTLGPIAVGPTRVRFGDSEVFTKAVSGNALAGGRRGGERPELFMQLSSAKVAVGEPLIVQFFVAVPPEASGEGWDVQASFPDSWSERIPAGGAPPAGRGVLPPGLLPLAGWLVIPVHAGRLEIPPAVARAADWGAEPDNPGAPALTATSRPQNVEVAELPPAPAPFFGAVGDLEFSRRLVEADAAGGDLASVEVSVRGAGNLPLLEPPPLPLPAGVRSFEPEESHAWKPSRHGLVGWRRWRIPIEARPGTYELPEVTFCTYRPGRSYASQTLPALTLAVRPPAAAAPAAAPLRREPAPPLPAAAIAAAAFLAGAGTVLAARAWRGRGGRRPRPSADAPAELLELQLAVQAWAHSRYGVAAADAPEALTAAGCPPADAAEAAALVNACERLRLAPGLGDPADTIPDLRLRVDRLTATAARAAARLEG
ncbi:MAG TPA: hypothetical protein PK435_05705 [Thermoanaerobaculaceae bacterium]|nr:hypothetical protein [Thermoanaerobaculaceae bacterium]